MKEFDELEQTMVAPADRTTKPPPTDREMLEDILDKLSAMAVDLRTVALNATNAIGQGQSLNRRVSDLEGRVSKLEQRSMNGSEHPEAT